MTSHRFVEILLSTVGVLVVIAAVLITEALVFHEESTAIVREGAAPPAREAVA